MSDYLIVYPLLHYSEKFLHLMTMMNDQKKMMRSQLSLYSVREIWPKRKSINTLKIKGQLMTTRQHQLEKSSSRNLLSDLPRRVQHPISMWPPARKRKPAETRRKDQEARGKKWRTNLCYHSVTRRKKGPDGNIGNKFHFSSKNLLLNLSWAFKMRFCNLFPRSCQSWCPKLCLIWF